MNRREMLKMAIGSVFVDKISNFNLTKKGKIVKEIIKLQKLNREYYDDDEEMYFLAELPLSKLEKMLVDLRAYVETCCTECQDELDVEAKGKICTRCKEQSKGICLSRT